MNQLELFEYLFEEQLELNLWDEQKRHEETCEDI